MVTITSTVSGNNVTFQVTYSFTDVGLPETWGVYIYGTINRNLGSGPDPNYPYYVEEFHGTGTSTVTRTEITDSYVAVLALTGYGQVDYTLFAVTPSVCQPPGGVQRYCQDASTICVWNQVDCTYNCSTCSTGACSNGNCVPPTSHKYRCINNVCTQDDVNGTFTEPTCGGTCAAPPPTSGCIPACTSSQICLNAIGLGCQPKIYVYGAVAGFFALMMLR